MATTYYKSIKGYVNELTALRRILNNQINVVNTFQSMYLIKNERGKLPGVIWSEVDAYNETLDNFRTQVSSTEVIANPYKIPFVANPAINTTIGSFSTVVDYLASGHGAIIAYDENGDPLTGVWYPYLYESGPPISSSTTDTITIFYPDGTSEQKTVYNTVDYGGVTRAALVLTTTLAQAVTKNSNLSVVLFSRIDLL